MQHCLIAEIEYILRILKGAAGLHIFTCSKTNKNYPPFTVFFCHLAYCLCQT